MLIEERFDEILKILHMKKTVTVQELTELLNTSESTIRRDLTQLNKLGKLTKVHGGATVPEMNYTTQDSEIEKRYDLNRDDKARIARYAAELVRSGDFIFIDGGTSTELMVDYITEKNAVYVTNAIEHGKKLVHKGCKVHMLGGELKAATETTVGAETIEVLSRLHFTKCFLGTNGISLERGYTTPEMSEAMVKRKAMEISEQNYIISDPSKFLQIASVSFGDYYDANILTTHIDEAEFKNKKNIIQVDRL